MSRMLLISFVSLTLLAGCEGGGKSTGGSPSSGAAATSAPAKPKAKEVTLEAITDADKGYEIKIPKGSKELQKNEFAHTFSLVLPGGMHEFNTHLSFVGNDSLDALVRNATMMGGKDLKEKKKIDGGFMVVKAARMSVVEVWVSKKGKTKGITVKCSGPEKELARLQEICQSLKVTK